MISRDIAEHVLGRKCGLGRWHGSAEDRGSADYYYWRERDPHFWPDGTYNGVRVEAKDMTPLEIAAYNKGYDDPANGRKEY